MSSPSDSHGSAHEEHADIRWLSGDRIEKVHVALMEAKVELAPLFSALPPLVRASLPNVSSCENGKLLHALNDLNQRDDSALMETVLDTAGTLLIAYPIQRSVVDAARAELGGHGGRAPLIDKDVRGEASAPVRAHAPRRGLVVDAARAELGGHGGHAPLIDKDVRGEASVPVRAHAPRRRLVVAVPSAIIAAAAIGYFVLSNGATAGPHAGPVAAPTEGASAAPTSATGSSTVSTAPAEPTAAPAGPPKGQEAARAGAPVASFTSTAAAAQVSQAPPGVSSPRSSGKPPSSPAPTAPKRPADGSYTRP